MMSVKIPWIVLHQGFAKLPVIIYSSINLCIFVWPVEVLYTSIDKEIHVKTSVLEMICGLSALRH